MYGSRIRGMEVYDADGVHIGTAADTWPADGGGEPEMVLVKVGSRFARLRYLPLKRARFVPAHRALVIDATRLEIEDAPSAEDCRWGDPAHVAKAHWHSSWDD